MRTVSVLAACGLAQTRFNEYVVLPGVMRENRLLAQPHEYVSDDAIPAEFNWGNLNGESYVTKNLNQHIPQYCGSCWAHGAMSALADRIKIANMQAKPKVVTPEIALSIQEILNCGGDTAGSCHGGSHHGAYQFVKEQGFIPYDTCNSYLACSAESSEGFCSKAPTSCNAIDKCRTCSTFSDSGGFCAALDTFPNATIAEFGSVTGASDMQKEIFKRGPIACGVDATKILTYPGGIATAAGEGIDHIISIIGWGKDSKEGNYWIVRNSWGEYWGEMGYFRAKFGSLSLEDDCAWATPGKWTTTNFACYEDGTNCKGSMSYTDPVHEAMKVKEMTV